MQLSVYGAIKPNMNKKCKSDHSPFGVLCTPVTFEGDNPSKPYTVNPT